MASIRKIFHKKTKEADIQQTPWPSNAEIVLVLTLLSLTAASSKLRPPTDAYNVCTAGQSEKQRDGLLLLLVATRQPIGEVIAPFPEANAFRGRYRPDISKSSQD